MYYIYFFFSPNRTTRAINGFKNKFPDGQHRSLVVDDVEKTEKEFDPRHAGQPPAAGDGSKTRNARQVQRLRDGQPRGQREHFAQRVSVRTPADRRTGRAEPP